MFVGGFDALSDDVPCVGDVSFPDTFNFFTSSSSSSSIEGGLVAFAFMGTRGTYLEPFDEAEGNVEVEPGEAIGAKAEEMLPRKFVEAWVMSLRSRDALLDDFVNVSVFCISSHFLLISDHGEDEIDVEVKRAWDFLVTRSAKFLVGLEFFKLSDS